MASPWWQEISRLCVSIDPKIFATIPAGSPARDDDAGRQHTVIPGSKLTRTMPYTPSFRPQRSGVEKSHTEGRRPMVAGDLSTLRFIRAQSPCHPYRQVPPLEMTMSADSIQSCPGEKIEQNDAPHPRHFDRSRAEWRNLTP